MRCVFSIVFILGTIHSFAADKFPTLLDNNLKCVDLSDLKGPLPLDVVSTTQILKQTENWEHSSWKNPQWPKDGHRSLGYPTLDTNNPGKPPDGHY